jgi:hypothetical protein
MNFREMFSGILGTLGLVDKAKTKTLSDDDWKKIESAFKEKYNTTFSEAMLSSEQTAKLEGERTKALNIINTATQEENADDNNGDSRDNANPENSGKDNGENKTSETLLDGVNTLVNKVNSLSEQNKELKQTIEKMTPKATTDNPETEIKTKITVYGPGTTEQHLFGIENSLFDMNKRWNKVSDNPAYSTLNPADEEKDGAAYRTEVRNYGKSLADRYHFLQNNKMLDPQKLNAGFGNDFTHLKDAGLGDQYLIFRQDALIARIISLQNIYHLFPRRYGVQDRELMTNAFFSEVSQAYQEGEVWKGGMELQPEIGHVDDSMAKIKFGSLKEIERKYIGYLNTDGSDPIKWGMIEWQLLQIYTQMVNEQNRRRIRGIYIKPEANIPGSYLNSSTGLVYTMVRYMHENTLLPHSDDSYNSYTKATMLDAVLLFIEEVKESLDEDLDLDGFALYLNNNHRDWWIACCRDKYKGDQDFTGPMSYANVVPDTTIPIKWVPNNGQSKLIFLQEPGNLQCLEFVPGEMLKFGMQGFMEQVMAWATWKEGFTATFIGKHFSSLATLKANDYSLQRVFCNKPSVTLDDKKTSIVAKKDFWFVTPDNTAATALTDITDAKKGVAYIIECGGTSNPTTIAKAGKFDTISSAYTPTAIGDYIMVALNKAGTFIELERTVGGVRIINKVLQPNIPGAR